MTASGLSAVCPHLPLVSQLCVHNYFWSVSLVSTATSGLAICVFTITFGLSAVCPQLPLVCQPCPQLPLVCQLCVHSYLWSVSCVSTATSGLSAVCPQLPLVCQLCVHSYLWSVSCVSTATSGLATCVFTTIFGLSAVCPQLPLVCQLCVHSYLWSCHLCVHNCLEWHKVSLNKSWLRLQVNVLLCVCRCGPLHQAASPAQRPEVHHCWHSMAWLCVQM